VMRIFGLSIKRKLRVCHDKKSIGLT